MTGGRLALACAACALPIGALIACTAGDPIAYQGPNEDSGILPDDAGRLIRESSVGVPPPANDGGALPALEKLSCPSLSPDGGCNVSMGLGCCLPSAAGSQADDSCVEQVQYYAGKICEGATDVFLACLASNVDSACCFAQGRGGSGMSVRYRADCDGGIEACDPTADAAAGAVCPNTGGDCTPFTCRFQQLGYCGAKPPSIAGCSP